MAETEPKLPSRDEIIAQFRAGLGNALTQAAANYVMPVCWIAAEGGKPLILGNGSAFALNCGAGPFLVTAAHVHRAYCLSRAERPDTVCMVGDTRIDIHERLIAIDDAWDVATFKLTPQDILDFSRRGNVPLTGHQKSWPPAPPQQDRGVFFVGFPGDGRTMRPYRGGNRVEVDYVGYTVLTIAISVSPVGITTVLQHDPEFDIGMRPTAPPDWALGGCSGAPILTFVEHKGVSSWRLGGIIYEASSLIIKASRADCLNSDGTILNFPDPTAYLRRK